MMKKIFFLSFLFLVTTDAFSQNNVINTLAHIFAKELASETNGHIYNSNFDNSKGMLRIDIELPEYNHLPDMRSKVRSTIDNDPTPGISWRKEDRREYYVGGHVIMYLNAGRHKQYSFGLLFSMEDETLTLLWDHD